MGTNRRSAIENPYDAHNRARLRLLMRFVANHGWQAFNAKTEVDGVRLGLWVTRRRGEYARGQLADWLCAELEGIPGWEWDPNAARHQRHLSALRDYVARAGTFPRRGEVTVDGADLNKWMHACRRQYRAHSLPRWLQRELETLEAWEWYPSRRRFAPDGDLQAGRTPRELVASACRELGKDPAEVIDEIERLVHWIDKETDAKQESLPAAILEARRIEGRKRPHRRLKKR